MRKGFIQTLTALVTAFLVTSAMALGPELKPIPDVYIGPEAASGAPAETGVNTFRYSEALTLWNYVTPGVLTGDGSTSDTLYWAWAAKAADLTGGSGAFLAPSSTNYTILQENAVEATQLQPTNEVGDAGWVAEINGALTSLGSGLSDYAVGAAGKLTFRDIRLSPLPEVGSYPAPTPDTGAPAGTLGVQEATVYVSDTNTTPGTDTFLLVTVPTGEDFLSGGASWTTIQDYSTDATPFVIEPFSTFAGNIADAKAAIIIPNPGASLTIVGGTVTMTVPLTNSTGTYGYSSVTAPWPGTGDATADNVYALIATVASSNTSASANPSAVLGINGRTTCGYAYLQMTQGFGPTVSSGPQDLTAYLIPSSAGQPTVSLAVYDPGNANGGTLTYTGVQLVSAPKADVLGSATVVTTYDTFDIGGATEVATKWVPLVPGGIGYGGYSLPTFTLSPSSGTASSVSLTASTNTYTNSAADQRGFYSLEGPRNGFATVPGKLYLAAFSVSTSSLSTAKLPTLWVGTAEPTGAIQAGTLFDRPTDGSRGPTSTPADFYACYEATDSVGAVNFRAMAESTNTSGNLIVDSVTVYEADVPSGP